MPPLTAGERERVRCILKMISVNAITAEVFETVFDDVGAGSEGVPLYQAILANKQGRGALAYQAAAELAVEQDFDAELLVRLARKTGGNLAPQDTKAVRQVNFGEHHGMIGDGALWDDEWLDILGDARARLGLVKDERGHPLGTAFLIGPDLALTSAHVVWSAIEKKGNAFTEKSTRKLYLEFQERRSTQGLRPPRIVLLASPRWLEQVSPPCGPPGDLNLIDRALALTNLDYAVIRLAEPIGDERTYFRDVGTAPEPENNTDMAIIGFPGGTARRFSIERLTVQDLPICRLRHHASAVAGMSGSPCLTIDGNVVGLHEGAAKLSDNKTDYNRSIFIGRLGAKLIQIAAPASTEVRWLPAAIGGPLLREIESILVPRATFSPSALHPVFGRSAFQHWIGEALSGTGQRVAVISGDDGAGKSFSIDLLNARLKGGREREVVCWFPPESARAVTPAEILTRLNAAASQPLSTDASSSNLRPEAGQLRHDVIPNGFDEIRQAMVGSGNRSDRRLWIVADFGRGETGWDSAVGAWRELLVQASRHDWIRLVLVGVSRKHQGELLGYLPVSPLPFTEHVGEVDPAPLHRFLIEELQGRLDTGNMEKVSRSFLTSWGRIATSVAAERRTMAAVRAVIGFKEGTIHRGDP